jgi:hypothetical protein
MGCVLFFASWAIFTSCCLSGLKACGNGMKKQERTAQEGKKDVAECRLASIGPSANCAYFRVNITVTVSFVYCAGDLIPECEFCVSRS